MPRSHHGSARNKGGRLKSRARGKKPKQLLRGSDGQHIKLQNPVSDNFASWIFGNATLCDHVVTADSAKGQTLILCGAGPTLRDHAAEYCPQGDQVWGCNSAVTWLYDQGHKVTHGYTVDQTAHMLEEWHSAPPVEYLLASSVHPHLAEYLIAKGRPVRFFHNYVGVKERPVEIDGEVISYEEWLYSAFYPPTVQAGSGLSSINRAIDIALFMGFARICVLGADCAIRLKAPKPEVPFGSPEHMRWLREGTEMHADGGHALASEATPITMGGVVDGRYWESKPDLMVSAVWLVKTAQAHKGRIEIVGDTLPQALMDKPDSYLKRLPTLIDGAGREMTFDTV